MKKISCLIMVLLVFTVSSCTPAAKAVESTATNTATPVPTVTSTLTATPTPTVTLSPTPTFTSSPIPTVRETVLAEHEAERIAYLAEEGPATEIPVLEYHGDNYYIPIGNAIIEISPAEFGRQMEWFHENHVHSVTVQELTDWLAGKIELPARSVVLTFDMGNGSVPAITRIIPVFTRWQMFGIFTIFVKYMNDGESVLCVKDVCWQTFRDAYLSGYVDIGSHTMTHRDFAMLSETEGLAELTTSKNTIEEKIGNGLVVSSLTWPFESVPKWGSNISTIGFNIAFGGNTYPILENTIWRNKPQDFYQLPRILPPGSGGISGRPNDKTLQQIMQMYTSGWK